MSRRDAEVSEAADGRAPEEPGTLPAPRDAPRCLACWMEDPPPEMTCDGLGLHRGKVDHYVGREAGCPGCGRLEAACTARPCSARRGAR